MKLRKRNNRRLKKFTKEMKILWWMQKRWRDYNDKPIRIVWTGGDYYK